MTQAQEKQENLPSASEIEKRKKALQEKRKKVSCSSRFHKERESSLLVKFIMNDADECAARQSREEEEEEEEKGRRGRISEKLRIAFTG